MFQLFSRNTIPKDGSLFMRNPEIISKQFKNSVKIHIPGKKHFFSLDDVSADIWKFLDKPHTFQEVVDFILSHYAVSNKKTVENDISAFLSSAVKNKIVFIKK